MSTNKKIRKKLEQLYGKRCFIERLHLRKDTERKYTGKAQMKRMKQLTYHHILEKSKGGKATIENGALLSNENHIWFHQQGKQAQGYMNAMFQEYKRQIDKCSEECKIVFVEEMEIPYEIIPTEISLEEKMQNGYNRAKKKAEDRKLAQDYVDR